MWKKLYEIIIHILVGSKFNMFDYKLWEVMARLKHQVLGVLHHFLSFLNALKNCNLFILIYKILGTKACVQSKTMWILKMQWFW
jgi:hypothetical protein